MLQLYIESAPTPVRQSVQGDLVFCIPAQRHGAVGFQRHDKVLVQALADKAHVLCRIKPMFCVNNGFVDVRMP
jgi:hypothetical protein